MSRRVRIFVFGTVVLCALVVGLFTTKFGVYVVFDVLGDLAGEEAATSAVDGPIALDASLERDRTIPLAKAVEQPSGIDFDAARDVFVLTTDQSELFELSADLEEVVFEGRIRSGPLLLRQGKVEAVAAIGNGVIVGGELGRLEVWERTDSGWAKSRVIAFPEALGEIEVSALAYDAETATIFVASDESPRVYVLDAEGRVARTLKLQREAKPGRSFDEYAISGLAFQGGVLYAVTENFPTLIAVGPEEGAILGAFGVRGAGIASDVAVVGDRVYVTIDHNLFEARPGVVVYGLPELER